MGRGWNTHLHHLMVEMGKNNSPCHPLVPCINDSSANGTTSGPNTSRSTPRTSDEQAPSMRRYCRLPTSSAWLDLDYTDASCLPATLNKHHCDKAIFFSLSELRLLVSMQRHQSIELTALDKQSTTFLSI